MPTVTTFVHMDENDIHPDDFDAPQRLPEMFGGPRADEQPAFNPPATGEMEAISRFIEERGIGPDGPTLNDFRDYMKETVRNHMRMAQQARDTGMGTEAMYARCVIANDAFEHMIDSYWDGCVARAQDNYDRNQGVNRRNEVEELERQERELRIRREALARDEGLQVRNL